MNDLNIALKNIIKSKANKENYLKVLLQKKWELIVGKQIAEKSYPDRLSGKIVFLNIATSAWAHNLLTMKELLLEKINESIKPLFEIKDIKFSVGKILYEPIKQEEKEDIIYPDLDDKEKGEIEKLVCDIKDQDLYEAVYAVLAEDRKYKKYYFAKFLSVCEDCGAVLSYKNAKCAACDNLYKENIRETLIREIYQVPWLHYDDIKDSIDIGFDEFLQVKNECREIFKNRALQKNATDNEKRMYAMIKTGLDVISITDKDVAGVMKNAGRLR